EKNLTPAAPLRPLAVAAHGVRRGRRDGDHLPNSPAPLLLYPVPLTAPFRLPPRRRFQASRRRRQGGRQRPRIGRWARAHRPCAVRALPIAALQGCGHGAGGERCHGERLDDGIGDGGAASSERWVEQAGGVDTPLVALHKIPTAADAGGLHLQRVWAAYNQGHQSSCLHRCAVVAIYSISWSTT
ncbi:unnamed protein product, partial [Urochloa humidicola]